MYAYILDELALPNPQMFPISAFSNSDWYISWWDNLYTQFPKLFFWGIIRQTAWLKKVYAVFHVPEVKLTIHVGRLPVNSCFMNHLIHLSHPNHSLHRIKNSNAKTCNNQKFQISMDCAHSTFVTILTGAHKLYQIINSKNGATSR